jgi:hypothetical protein
VDERRSRAHDERDRLEVERRGDEEPTEAAAVRRCRDTRIAAVSRRRAAVARGASPQQSPRQLQRPEHAHDSDTVEVQLGLPLLSRDDADDEHVVAEILEDVRLSEHAAVVADGVTDEDDRGGHG